MTQPDIEQVPMCGETDCQVRCPNDPVIDDLLDLSGYIRVTKTQVLSDTHRKQALAAILRIRDAWEATR